MRKKIIAGNWKMNLLKSEGIQLVSHVLQQASMKPHQEIIFAPPYPFISEIKNKLDASNQFKIAAQNCHQAEKGAFTGEVSASILKSFGCNYVILGHSERRQYFNETDTLLLQKLNAALAADLSIIFCCGESLQIRENHEEVKFVIQQLNAVLGNLSKEQIGKIIIAYEPIWAIGTGRTALPEQVQEMHHSIRNWIKATFDEEVSLQTSILYGGSVQSENANTLLSLPDVDGALVGGASLQADSFCKIIEALP